MAEEVAYASVGSNSNKCMYEDSPSPVELRATGFSSPPDSAIPPPSYNSIPPPMNEIELAKQKAHEIVVGLLKTSIRLKEPELRTGLALVGDLMLLMQVSKSQIYLSGVKEDILSGNLK